MSNKNLDDLIKNKKVIAVICNQFGDTGKGKFSDYFANCWADVSARGTGGNNAGHTVVVNGKERIFHLLPAGIVNDANGQINILGNGMVLDLNVLNQELDALKIESLTYEHLMISEDAQVIMPYHITRDQARNQSQKSGGIGSTGRGIGPCYTDKIARNGISMKDLYNKTRLFEKIEKALEFYPEQNLDIEQIVTSLQPLAERVQPFVKDTVTKMHNFVNQGKRVLIEGAQGLLLSIEHGTTPYVTSSDCSLNGTANGVGLSAKTVDLPLGIIKFPFMTRVGAGPFPTELGGRNSETYCASGLEHDIFYEASKHLGMPLDLEKIRDLQSKNKSEELKIQREKVVKYLKEHKADISNLCQNKEENLDDRELLKGVGLRLAALEYGATTARPRRIGWTDAVAAKYAVRINSPLFVLTKTDCIEGIDHFKICHGYENGTTSNDFKRSEIYLRGVKPKYQGYTGYKEVSSVTEYEKLPGSLKTAISDFEEFTGGRAVAISVGAEREQTIIRGV